jgi:DNA-binding transcriptional regulator YdaS (Cro superfamily)
MRAPLINVDDISSRSSSKTLLVNKKRPSALGFAPPMASGTRFQSAYAGPATMTGIIIMATGVEVVCRDVKPLNMEWKLIPSVAYKFCKCNSSGG